MSAAVEIVFVAVVGAAAAVYVVDGARRRGRATSVAVVAVLFVAVAALGLRAAIESRDVGRTRDLTGVDYTTSASCQKCHTDQYASWARTYHSTMTQDASPASVIGDFDDVELTVFGHRARLYRDGDEHFMELVDREWERDTVQRGIDPATVANPPRRAYRVDRTVGSNQMQVYLHRSPDGTFIVLPLEWNRRERRWVTAAGNYLQPPSESPWLWAHVAIWNQTCVFCHNTRPNPGRTTAEEFETNGLRYVSEVEELGIACEACHGPAAAHVRRHHDPVARYLRAFDDLADPAIVHPARLDQDTSLDLCGRCHGKFGARPAFRDSIMREGELYVPAHVDLHSIHREPTERPEHASGRMDRNGYFWPDGTPRPTAMEYQGTKLSPCAQRGPMTCLDCHSMHEADPVDQLRFPDDPATANFEDDAACIQCHTSYAEASVRAGHSRHAASSEGSRCVNCHMPFATFGLMKTVRTHRVVSPDAHVTATTRLPNGCNQCHVDRTLAWTARWLTEWYGHEPLRLLGDARDALSSTTVELLAGHALNRTLAAASLGWAPAVEAAPGDWAVPLLLEAMDDDYAAVRLNAWVALRTREGLAPERFDYLAPPSDRRRTIDSLREAWRRGVDPASLPSATAVGAEGLDPRWRRDLLLVRDRTPLTILE